MSTGEDHVVGHDNVSYGLNTGEGTNPIFHTGQSRSYRMTVRKKVEAMRERLGYESNSQMLEEHFGGDRRAMFEAAING